MQQRQRSGVIMGLMGLSLFVAAAIGSGPAQAATGNGPYYAEPAWAQKLPVATRFIELTDWSSAAVLDRETGLVWEKAPQVTAETWFSARGTCANKTIGNRKGWRLPSVHELASVIDPSQSNPALPLGHPFINVLSTGYWSATSNAETPTFAWNVGVGNGNVGTFFKTSFYQVWCVRGAMNADAY